MTPPPNKPVPPDSSSSQQEDLLRPHSYDGIQEYDKRLPNWWLLTFYGAIAFAVVYWFFYAKSGIPVDDGVKVHAEIARIEAERLASAASLDDATLWKMSRNETFVAAGRESFNANCTSCHLASLRGKSESPTAVGPDLTDTIWIHGGQPMDLYHTVTNGVPAKGMPTWGPQLGSKRITEAVAYILSHHQEGEPIIADPAAVK